MKMQTMKNWQKWDVGGWRNRSIAWPLYALAMIVFLSVLLPNGASAATLEPSMYVAPTKLSSLTPAVAGHTVTLNWVLSVDDDAASATPVNCVTAATCSQNVYKAAGVCSPTSSFSLVTLTALGPTVTTFSGSITPGVFCYAVTFLINGLESSKDTVTVSLPPSPVTSLTETSQ